MAENKRETIPFEEVAVKRYLDTCIRYWREQVRIDPDFAGYYVDAYQTVREWLFGERLPKEEKSE